MRYYKTAVKCKVAVALCTRVRTTVVFSKLNFKISLLVRTRVQSIAFERQNFDFESAFAVLFESTAKPQREAQKRLSEGNNCNITAIFQWFSNHTHDFHYKTADFWGSDFRGPFRSVKTMLWRTTMRQTAATAVPFRDFPTKPERKCQKWTPEEKTHRTPREPQRHKPPHRIIEKSEPHIATAMFGE